jgi:hypothetical protein
VRSYSFFAVDVANQTHFFAARLAEPGVSLTGNGCSASRLKLVVHEFAPSPDAEAYRLLSQVRSLSSTLSEPAKARTRFGKTDVLQCLLSTQSRH